MGSKIENFKAGEIIFKEGEPGGSIYIVKQGEVQVFKESESLEIPLTRIKKGEAFGILTFFPKKTEWLQHVHLLM